MFWAFGQCLQAFRTCRPVLCIKGTPLCGKYQGMLLTAVALDANDFSFPVACAVVEGETKESWLWFLRNLERAVVHQSAVCIIHDYKRDLINAMKDLLNSRERQWCRAESRWCMEDLAENFFAYFGDKKLAMMFKKLCQQKRRYKFGKIWKELDKLTSTYMAEKEHGASEEMQQESVEHDVAELVAQSPCNQHDSVGNMKEGDHADDSNRKIAKFSDWINQKPKKKWSLAYDSDGARYGIMGRDIADVYKNDHVLKGIACLPLSAIVEVTFLRLVKYFENTSATANKAIGNPSINFPEPVQVDMNSKMQKSETHRRMYTYANEKNYLGKVVDRKFTVKGRKREVTVHLKTDYTLRPQHE
uniref:MULE transposase domain-containing protein n=1 Tax=Triticum urartu TaxID=4572 RepID=A0A8R7PB71_TRIUA